MGKLSLVKYLNGQNKREIVEYAWNFGIYETQEKYAPDYNPETVGRWLNEVTGDPEFVEKATKNSMDNLPIEDRIIDRLICRNFKTTALAERLKKELAFVEEKNRIYKKRDKEVSMLFLKVTGGGRPLELPIASPLLEAIKV